MTKDLNLAAVLNSLTSRIGVGKACEALLGLLDESDGSQKSKAPSALFRYILGDQPLILVDLDGTIAEFKWTGVESYDPFLIGEPLPGAQEFCTELCKLGHVSVSTTRLNFWPCTQRETSAMRLRDTISEWLKKHSFPPEMSVSLDVLPPHVVYISDSCISSKGNATIELDLAKFMIERWKLERDAFEDEPHDSGTL